MKKLIIISVVILCMSYPLFPSVTSVEVKHVGATGQYIEAGTLNNPVLHIVITAPGGDTLTDLSVYNSLNSWYVGAVAENSTIANDGIKVWYSTVNTDDFSVSSPAYVTHLPRDASDPAWWYNTFSHPINTGVSHIWVTADIQQSPVFGTMEMQTENLAFAGSAVTSLDEPVNPYVLLVTSVAPAENLEVFHEPGSIQATVSTLQSYIIPVEYKLFNNSPNNSADITVSSLTLKIQTFPAPGTILDPSSIISSIKIQDKDQGTIYGELLPGFVPSAKAPFDIPISLLSIPAGTTTTVNAVVAIAANPSAADTEFIITLDSGAGISAYDYYTQKPVSVQASPLDTGFAMHSKQSKIQKKPDSINAWYAKILPEPQNINKGATNVELLKIGLENPGDTNTASAEIYNIKLYVEDGSGAPIVPRDIFSKISVTDESGNVKYRVKSFDTIETSGNTINFSLTTAIGIDSASRVTAVVRADISPSTVINSFKIKLAPPFAISCRDKNSFSPVAVSPAALPFYSSLALLSSSFTVSHSALMPSNIYKGQSGIHVMDLIMSSPLSFNNGNILVRGISLTAKDSSGGNLNFSSVFSGIRLQSSSQSLTGTAMPSASTCYFAFLPDVAVTTVTAETISVFADIINSPAADSIQLLVSADTAISAYQDNDTLRQIFIAPAAFESFPMSSGTGYIGGSSSGLAFSAYPVPFSKTQPCRLGYYLFAPAKVTIKIYDVMGNLVKTIIENSSKAAGSHSEDAWDGTDKNNRTALSGVYLAKIDAGGLGSAVSKAVFIK